MAVNSFGLLLGSLLLLLQSCARGLDTSTFKRPAEGLLANVSAIRAKCSYPFNGGTEFKGTRACFQWLEKNEQEYLKTPEELGIAPVNTSEPLIVHTVWNGDMTNPKLRLFLDGFLFSQPRVDGAQAVQLWVWIVGLKQADRELPDFELPLDHVAISRMPRRLLCNRLIKFKRWDISKVAAQLPDTVWTPDIQAYIQASPANRAMHLQAFTVLYGNDFSVSYSDLMRFLLLGVYGGLYLDADVLLLRDFRPLQVTPCFWYMWENTGGPNTAVFFARRGDSVLHGILEVMLNDSVVVNNTTGIAGLGRPANWHPLYLSSTMWKSGKPQCTLLPCNVFNALAWRESQALEKEFGGWGLQTYATFHRAADPEATVQNVNGFLRGAFACHWHNNWKDEFGNGTWGKALQEAHKLYFGSAKLPNLYGEKFDWNTCFEESVM